MLSISTTTRVKPSPFRLALRTSSILAHTRLRPRAHPPHHPTFTPSRPTSNMSKPQVLLLGDIDHAHSTWQALSTHASLITPTSTTRAAFIAECDSGAFDRVQAIYRTFASLSTTGPIDAELVPHFPRSLRLIAHNGAGYDQLSIPPLSEAGILAANVPTAVDDATADTALWLLLGALRNFGTSVLALRRGEWRGDPPPGLGHDPQGKVLGVVGFGGIGKCFARKARAALGMRVVYTQRTRLSREEEEEEGAEYRTFEECLGEADVLSVHVPLNEGTKHLLGRREFGMCKEGVVVVNTARGAVIDEAALVEALESGRVGCAGLDVYEEEPVVHEGLVKNERVLLLPHMGTWTVETQTEMEKWCIGNVECALKWLNGGEKEQGRRISVVPEQKELWGKMLEES